MFQVDESAQKSTRLYESKQSNESEFPPLWTLFDPREFSFDPGLKFTMAK